MNNMKILFISLGCDKNLVDSEHMLGLLVEHGFEITDSEEDAEVIVINTCCFIHDAKEESIQNILEMAKYRTAGSCKVLLVTGCMAERYRDEIIEEIPEVDAVLGTNSYDKILDAIQDVLGGDRFQEYADLKGLPKIDAQRVVTTGGHYEYLKIAEGCDKHCTYCIIPKLRGPYRSVPMEELIAEAKTMAEQGVKELVLVAQETTIYGIDLYGKPSLHLLLKELCKIQELYWIRILYCYPEDIYPELVQTMKEEPKVCHYLDLPIQHANDEILRRMGRRTSKQELIDKIDFLRSEMPDITLRTTLITGFPGETKAKTMAEQGVKELVLVAQETTIYGIDLYGKPSLHLLLKELCKIQELYWIRILYCYPEDIYPELVQTMKEEPKVCHYLDLPIQHANDEILRRMGRRTSKQELIDKIDFLRSEMPDITLRTTLITGFPGETKEQHKELLEFINDMEFDRLGVFTYSPEEGTPAAAMEHQIDEEVKLDRQAELMELQQDISAELGERRIGQELLVMIEGKVADEDAYVGRSQADAPGVDGYVFVNTPETLVSGDFVRVKITGALEYDLIGEISQ